jgi:hypothetical protein
MYSDGASFFLDLKDGFWSRKDLDALIRHIEKYQNPTGNSILCTSLEEPLQNSNIKKRLENGSMQSFEW